ncbi:MAG TPA: hypothetical protein VGB92_04965 [Longimicrobium sp.]
MKTKSRTLFATLVIAAVAAGCTDWRGSPTSPTNAAGAAPRYDALGGECTPAMIICDDGSERRWTDDGFEEVYTDFADGDLSFEHESSESTSAGSYQASYTWSGCPSYVVGVAYGNVYVTNPSGGKTSVRFMSSGTWSWMADIGPNMARYNWPPGYWDAIDGSGIQVQVGSVEGFCRTNDRGYVYVAFTGRFHHVNARFPRRRGYYLASGGGGGGEDDGGGGQCREEYVYVEVDYGDGTGWHVIWEGTATVCD